MPDVAARHFDAARRDRADGRHPAEDAEGGTARRCCTSFDEHYMRDKDAACAGGAHHPAAAREALRLPLRHRDEHDADVRALRARPAASAPLPLAADRRSTGRRRSRGLPAGATPSRRERPRRRRAAHRRRRRAAKLDELGAENALRAVDDVVLAPRGVDKLLELARELCEAAGVPRRWRTTRSSRRCCVQCAACMKAIAACSANGRLDAFVQSTDKPILHGARRHRDLRRWWRARAFRRRPPQVGRHHARNASLIIQMSGRDVSTTAASSC